ncbi:hypothetical protein JJL56_01630 [Azospirillum sp. YIM DDC1]|uniref:DUF222 domain-containing protein n=1 Tax=Azospirillum aestuarii TaxID=2802052 RepID=A0ABS1HRV8_9PROT|nr:hypothetical protein [Azospirillum aestuarii]MBK4717561.1 hypothetical protein [Azospirillum aestuarii]
MVTDCPVKRGGCGWSTDSDILSPIRDLEFRLAAATKALRTAPLPVAVDAVRRAEHELTTGGADLTVLRFRRRRACLGQHGVGAGRVKALRDVSVTARRVCTDARGEHAYRWYWPLAVVMRAAEIAAASVMRAPTRLVTSVMLPTGTRDGR